MQRKMWQLGLPLGEQVILLQHLLGLVLVRPLAPVCGLGVLGVLLAHGGFLEHGLSVRGWLLGVSDFSSCLTVPHFHVL